MIFPDLLLMLTVPLDWMCFSTDFAQFHPPFGWLSAISTVKLKNKKILIFNFFFFVFTKSFSLSEAFFPNRFFFSKNEIFQKPLTNNVKPYFASRKPSFTYLFTVHRWRLTLSPGWLAGWQAKEFRMKNLHFDWYFSAFRVALLLLVVCVWVSEELELG